MLKQMKMIGIGASAGGLTALREFFSNAVEFLPDSCFLVSLHYPPDSQTHLDQLLSGFGELKSTVLDNRAELLPGMIHIVPPGHRLAIDNMAISLVRLKSGESPAESVDNLFSILAKQYGERVVGIVLSGTLSDGSAGAIAIKEHGGLVVAQAPAEAEFPEMPENAIATGVVDIVSPVAGMAQAIKLYFDGLQALGAPPSLQEDWRSPATTGSILDILKAQTGQDFTDYKPSTINRRIQRRMSLRGIRTVREYEKILNQESEERKQLLRDMLINVTSFFRDPQTWVDLKTKVLIPMVHESEMDAVLRVWVAGCATGEEAYTMAMVLTEAFEETGRIPAFQLFATDIEENSLARARSGLFSKASVSSLDKIRLERFIIPKGADYAVIKPLRDRILFARHNAASDPPFSNLDLISCRNLLIYFSHPLQERVLRIFHFALRHNGMLLLGSSESLGGLEGLFKAIPSFPKCFKKASMSQLLPEPFTVPRYLGGGGGGRSGEHRSQDRIMGINTLLLARFCPALVIVNNKFDVVHFSGPVGKYMDFPPGPPTQNLIDLLRDGLRVRVQNTLRKAFKQEGQAEAAKVRYALEGSYYYVRCVAEYIAAPGPVEGMALLYFEELEDKAVSELSANDDIDGYSQICQLEDELKTTKEELRLSIMDLESSLCELRTVNEELLSTNEEYQSANEELVTSKEECQSLNEELNSVNSELHEKVLELEKVTNDLRNLIESSRVPTLFWDREFKLRRITLAASEVLGVKQADIGRHVRAVAALEWDGDLLMDVAGVTGGEDLLQRECATSHGRWYLRRALPYRDQNHLPGGVIVTYTDITDQKTAATQLAETKDLLEAVVEQSPVPMAVAPLKLGAVPIVNSAFINITGADRECISDIDCLLNSYSPLHADGTPYAIGERCLPLAMFGAAKREEEIRLRRPDGMEFWAMLICTPILDETGKTFAAMVALPDITKIKKAEEELIAAKEAAERANQSKSVFLANMSHEIRTPVQGLVGLLQLLQISDLGSEHQEYVNMALKSASRLTSLITDILDLSRLDAGKMILRPAAFSLPEMLKLLEDSFSPNCLSEGIELSFRIDPDVPRQILGDEVRIRQIIFNIVGNAVKFTSGGAIRVHVGQARASNPGSFWLIVTVADTGIGISEDMLDTVFEPFGQVEQSYARQYQGAGLGLALVKKLLELMEGSITMESAPGAGTVVEFSVNVATVGELNSPAPEAQAEPIARDISKIRVLLAEDDHITRLTVAEMLQKKGYQISTVPDGLEALEALERDEFDILLLDVQMPGMSGYDVARAIRGERRFGSNSRIPIIAFTGYVMPEDRDLCLAAGMDDHVAKAVGGDELSSAILRVLAKRKA